LYYGAFEQGPVGVSAEGLEFRVCRNGWLRVVSSKIGKEIRGGGEPKRGSAYVIFRYQAFRIKPQERGVKPFHRTRTQFEA
jgi:hypothetical protein